MGSDARGSGLPWVEAIAASFPPYAFEAFHTTELPALVEADGALVVDDLRGVAPLAFRLPDGRAFTWRPTADGVQAVPGHDEAATVVELDEAPFSEVLHGLLTAVGALRTERAAITRGTLADWQRWEPAIQSLLTGAPVYSASVWDTLVDRDGRPLDLHRSFTPDDDPDELRRFLATTGFLHVRGVYTADEARALGDEVEAVRAATTPGDPFSWWSVDAGGAEVVTRINYLGRHSEVLQQHCFDERLTALAALAGDDLRVCDDRLGRADGVHQALRRGQGQRRPGLAHRRRSRRPPGDVPVAAGGHPARRGRPGERPAHGARRVTPRHEALARVGRRGRPAPRAHRDRPGDVTLHFGDTLHSTPPPTAPGAGRRALYYKFAEAKTFAWIPEGCHYNDALFHVEAGTGRVATRAATH